jgi:collagenase-like PrtC family protease
MRADFSKASRLSAPGCLRQRGFAGAQVISRLPAESLVSTYGFLWRAIRAGNRVVAVSVVLLVALVAVEAYERGLWLSMQLVVRNATAIRKLSSVGSGVLTNHRQRRGMAT